MYLGASVGACVSAGSGMLALGSAKRPASAHLHLTCYVAIGEAPGRWRVGVLVFLCACRPYYIKRRVCLMNIGVPIA